MLAGKEEGNDEINHLHSLPYQRNFFYLLKSGLEWLITIADLKAVSLNVMHASMDITDEIYRRLNEKDTLIWIRQLTMGKPVSEKINLDVIDLFQKFFEWQKNKRIKKCAHRYVRKTEGLKAPRRGPAEAASSRCRQYQRREAPML